MEDWETFLTKRTEHNQLANLDYHKGEWCLYIHPPQAPRFCQEGYCSECEIFKPKRKLSEINNLPAT